MTQEPRFCYDPRHYSPCPQPCPACVDECDPALVMTPHEYWARVQDYGEEEEQL